jgi:hypothetical protein
MIIRIYCILIFLSASVFGLNAQTDTTKTGTKVIFFGKDHSKPVVTYNSSALKFGLLDIASGLYGLHYEHEFSDIFGIMAGGGITGRNH